MTPTCPIARVRTDLGNALRYWPSLLSIAISWSFIFTIRYTSNQWEVYPLSKLVYFPLFVPIVFLPLTLFTAYFIIPKLRGYSRVSCIRILILSLGATCLLFLAFPAPLPGLSQNHHLSISSAARSGGSTGGTSVEVSKMRFLDGHGVPLEALSFSNGWKVEDGRIINEKTFSSPLELDGPMPGGVALTLRYGHEAGVAVIQWDEETIRLDLGSADEMATTTVLHGFSLGGLSAASTLLYFGAVTLYFAGMLALVVFFFVISDTPPSRLRPFLQILAFAFLVVVFVATKRTYLEFNGERVFRDTQSYVRASETLGFSPSILAGERSFTLPLLYRIIGITQGNVSDRASMRIVSEWQTALSILSWSFLGFSLARTLRRRFLRPVGFARSRFSALASR